MHTLAKNNVQFSFQSTTIVNIDLGKTGVLSTHHIRELGVYSKVKNGHYAKAYIISIDSTYNEDENLWRVYAKAARFAPDVLVAVVYPNNSLQANLQNFRAVLKPANRIQVFETYQAAITWTENKLNENDQSGQLSPSDLMTELTA